MGLESQLIIEPQQAGAIALSDDVNHRVTVAAPEELLISNPGGKKMLVLVAETGTWRMGVGDRTATGDNDMPGVAAPAANVTDGTGTYPLVEGKDIVLPAVDNITVEAYNIGDTLTYFWL